MGAPSRIVFACALLAGCDNVFGISQVPGVPADSSIDLGCTTRSALLCADFEQGSSYYANGIASDLPMATGSASADVAMPGTGGGHALYIDSTRDVYRFDARSTASASRITATFALDLARFDATTPGTSLAVLYFDGVPVQQCYVALDFQPMPMRLSLVANCMSQSARDLAIPLPSGAAFVQLTLDVDLATGMGSAHLGANSATVVIDPGGATTGMPGAGFGFIDPLAGTGARLGIDDVLVIATP